MKSLTIPIICSLLFSACQNAARTDGPDQWKAEILQAEAGFAKMAGEEGIAEAFLAYAAADAVLMRNNRVIEGRQAIREWFEGQPPRPGSQKLEWQPDFTAVSEAGDLGYTYGKYTFTTLDSTGTEHAQTGIFHTVWKRQPDGSWKFVWD